MEKRIIIIVIILIGIFLIWKSCNKREDSRISELLLTKQKLDSIVNERNQTIYTQQSIITDNQKSISSLTDTIFALKKKDKKNREVIAYWRNWTNTTLPDSLLIPYEDTTQITLLEDSLSSCRSLIGKVVPVPLSASLEAPYYSLDMTVRKDGVQVNHLSIPDTLHLQFVEHKRFLRKPTIEVQFFHSNPLVTTQGSNSVFYKPKPKKRILEKALLIGMGIFIGTKL